MSDLFQDGVPTDYITRVARVMRAAHWHTYQVLTKRHERLRDLLRGELRWLGQLPHVWFGVSVEDRRHGLPRIEALRATPVTLRFLSIEPLLEDLGRVDLTAIDWVIVGGESGAGARPMQEGWVVSLMTQCRRARVPFFFKQWGGTRKSARGRSLLGQTFNEFPQGTHPASAFPAVQ